MALSIDHLVPIFLQCAELIPDIHEMACDKDGRRWAIGFEDDLVVTVENVGESDMLSLCANVGKPHEQDRLRVWRMMLLYGSSRASNGGFSMAVADQEGECQLLCDLHAHDLDMQKYEATLVDFASKARKWRQFIQSDGIGHPHAGELVSTLRC